MLCCCHKPADDWFVMPRYASYMNTCSEGQQELSAWQELLDAPGAGLLLSSGYPNNSGTIRERLLNIYGGANGIRWSHAGAVENHLKLPS